MTQERGPDDLSEDEIAHRIGAIEASPLESPPSPAPAEDPYAARLIAVQRALSQQALSQQALSQPGVEPSDAPPVSRISASIPPSAEPRVRLIRDSAATLVGLSAVALIVIAVWPPSPNGGVMGATATPPGPSTTATAPSSPEPTPTPEPTPSFEP